MGSTLAGMFVAAALLVLAIDLALNGALAMVQVGSPGRGWLSVHIAARAVWVLMALLLWLAARTLRVELPPMARARAARTVGGAIVAVTVAWQLATWIVFAAAVTWRGAWDVDGRILLEPSYYSRLVLGTAPWLLAGAVLLAAARHLDER